MQQADPNDKSEVMKGPVKIFCKGDPKLNIAVRGDKVILVRDDPNDRSQHWFQDFAVGKLTDSEGRRPFALVNSTTGQAMVNGTPVELVSYSRNVGVKVSMLWSLGKELSDGYVEIRTLEDISSTLNGLNGYVHQGTVIGVYDSSPTAVNSI